jgi:hypothetical protein
MVARERRDSPCAAIVYTLCASSYFVVLCDAIYVPRGQRQPQSSKGRDAGFAYCSAEGFQKTRGPEHVEGTWVRRAWPDAGLHNGSMEGGRKRLVDARKAGEQLVVHAMSASVGFAAQGERPRAARTSSAGVVTHGRQWQWDAGCSCSRQRAHTLPHGTSSSVASAPLSQRGCSCRPLGTARLVCSRRAPSQQTGVDSGPRGVGHAEWGWSRRRLHLPRAVLDHQQLGLRAACGRLTAVSQRVPRAAMRCVEAARRESRVVWSLGCSGWCSVGVSARLRGFAVAPAQDRVARAGVVVGVCEPERWMAAPQPAAQPRALRIRSRWSADAALSQAARPGTDRGAAEQRSAGQSAGQRHGGGLKQRALETGTPAHPGADGMDGPARVHRPAARIRRGRPLDAPPGLPREGEQARSASAETGDGQRAPRQPQRQPQHTSPSPPCSRASAPSPHGPPGPPGPPGPERAACARDGRWGCAAP